MKASITIIIYIVLFLSNAAFAAEISTEKTSSPNGYRILIKGEIIKGDYTKLVSILKSKNGFPDVFKVTSPGGDVVEAIKIGKLLRDSLSFVIATKTCNSACFIIYTGASYNKLPLTQIGIHRPKYDDHYFSGLSYDEAQKKYKELDVLVRNYLKEMYVDTSLIEQMFSTSSDNIKYIPPLEMIKLVPLTSPTAQEWLSANCVAPTNKEQSDIASIINSSIKGESRSESQTFSKGYLDYLLKKIETNEKCKLNIITKTQLKIIKAL